MKKLHLVFFSLCFSVLLNAQISNNSLESWSWDTATFGFAPLLPDETFPIYDPSGFSTSNQATKHSLLGAFVSVSRDTIMKAHLNASAKLESSFLSIAGVSATIPGVLVNGNFKINATDFVAGFDPARISGTGTQITGKPSKIIVHLNYEPVSSDTAEFFVALVDSARNLVALGSQRLSSSTTGFKRFEVPFAYSSCNRPDTFVMIATSSPFSNGAGSGSPGSVLWVDSLGISYTPAVNVPPTAVTDFGNTVKNTAVTIDVKANDFDCEGSALTVTAASGSLNGTVAVVGGSVRYTPNTNFVGDDAFSYTVCDAGSSCSIGTVNVNVANGVGINDANENIVSLYPVPANNNLIVNVSKAASYSYEFINVYGEIVENGKLNNTTQSINTSEWKSGVYIVRILDSSNAQVIAKSIVINH